MVAPPVMKSAAQMVEVPVVDRKMPPADAGMELSRERPGCQLIVGLMLALHLGFIFVPRFAALCGLDLKDLGLSRERLQPALFAWIVSGFVLLLTHAVLLPAQKRGSAREAFLALMARVDALSAWLCSKTSGQNRRLIVRRWAAASVARVELVAQYDGKWTIVVRLQAWRRHRYDPDMMRFPDAERKLRRRLRGDGPEAREPRVCAAGIPGDLGLVIRGIDYSSDIGSDLADAICDLHDELPDRTSTATPDLDAVAVSIDAIRWLQRAVDRTRDAWSTDAESLVKDWSRRLERLSERLLAKPSTQGQPAASDAGAGWVITSTLASASPRRRREQEDALTQFGLRGRMKRDLLQATYHERKGGPARDAVMISVTTSGDEHAVIAHANRWFPPHAFDGRLGAGIAPEIDDTLRAWGRVPGVEVRAGASAAGVAIAVFGLHYDESLATEVASACLGYVRALDRTSLRGGEGLARFRGPVLDLLEEDVDEALRPVVDDETAAWMSARAERLRAAAPASPAAAPQNERSRESLKVRQAPYRAYRDHYTGDVRSTLLAGALPLLEACRLTPVRDPGGILTGSSLFSGEAWRTTRIVHAGEVEIVTVSTTTIPRGGEAQHTIAARLAGRFPDHYTSARRPSRFSGEVDRVLATWASVPGLEAAVGATSKAVIAAVHGIPGEYEHHHALAALCLELAQRLRESDATEWERARDLPVAELDVLRRVVERELDGTLEPRDGEAGLELRQKLSEGY